jgi:hypothetical protein
MGKVDPHIWNFYLSKKRTRKRTFKIPVDRHAFGISEAPVTSSAG